MRKLLKKSHTEVRLPELFEVENDKINLVEDIYSFFEDALIETIRSLSGDEKGEVVILNFAFDKSDLEKYTNNAIDDTTCKVIVKGLENQGFLTIMKEKYEEYVANEGYDMRVLNIDFEYVDNTFSSTVTCSR